MLQKNFPGRRYLRRIKTLEKLESIPKEKRTLIENITISNLRASTNMSFEQAVNIQTKKFGGKTGRKANNS